MKNYALLSLAGFFVCSVAQASFAACDRNCDKEAEYSYVCGGHMEYRGLSSRWVNNYCTGTNPLKRSACLTEKTACQQKERFQREVKKAETIFRDSKAVYLKVQAQAGKYKSIKMPKFPADSLKNVNPSQFVSGTYSAWKGYLNALEKAGISVEELNKMFGGKYESNKRDKMKEVESGGWIVAWGREINERDAGDGVVAAGVSIFSGGSASYIWAQRLVLDSIEKMGRSLRDAGNRIGEEARDRMTKVAMKVISDALKAKMPNSDSVRFGNIEAKAGLIKYSGTNSFKLPGGDRTTMSKTWGFIPYVAVRIR